MQTVVFGFGSQGRAQTLNLKDSGWKPSVFLRPSSSRKEEVLKEGLELITDPVQAAKKSELAIFLLPDSAQPTFWNEVLQSHLPPKATLCFAHGFNIHFQQILPRADIDVLLAAPSLQGDGLRKAYLEKTPVPMLTAVHQDATDRAYRTAEDLAHAIGGTKTDVIPTTFKEETETDLFAEQAVLCGGLNALIQAGFETLTDAGYSPKIAYYSCLKELKAIAESLYQRGIAGMRERISETARYGDVTRGPRIIDQHVRNHMQALLEEICSGKFAEELVEEKNRGWPDLKNRLSEASNNLIEKTRQVIETSNEKGSSS